MLSESDVSLRIGDHQESMHDEAHYAEEHPDEEPRRLRPEEAEDGHGQDESAPNQHSYQHQGPPFAASSLPASQIGWKGRKSQPAGDVRAEASRLKGIAFASSAGQLPPAPRSALGWNRRRLAAGSSRSGAR